MVGCLLLFIFGNELSHCFSITGTESLVTSNFFAFEAKGQLWRILLST